MFVRVCRHFKYMAFVIGLLFQCIQQVLYINALHALSIHSSPIQINEYKMVNETDTHTYIL